jgi:hypothetical protein
MRATAAPAEVDLVRETLAHGGSAWVHEAGASMAPLLRPGDSLRLAPLDPADARRGMLVAVAVRGRLVVHRLVRIDAGRLVTRGDALPSEDAPMAPAALVGRITALRGHDGHGLDFTLAPWPVVERLLGLLGTLAARARPRRLARLPLRAACHTLARLVR